MTLPTIITEFIPENELSETDVENNISDLIPFLKKSGHFYDDFQSADETSFEQMEIPFD